jgi:hypothetical protein
MFAVTYLDDERSNVKRRTVQTWDSKSMVKDYAKCLRRLLYASVKVVPTHKTKGVILSDD